MGGSRPTKTDSVDRQAALLLIASCHLSVSSPLHFASVVAMAPKGAKASPSKPAAKSDADNSTPPGTLNHMNRVHEAIKNIMNHDVFKSILESAPLSIAQGAHQAPFEGHDFEEAMKTGTYSCSGNFFWQDLVWLANHRVPVSLRQIKQFQ